MIKVMSFRLLNIMRKKELKDRISIAKGEKKADLVFKNGRIINVFSHEIIEASVAVYDGKIVGIGDYEGEEEIDLDGKYLSPGFIDGHVHIESSMVSPKEFAKAVVPRGTTGIIADPHEIANVCGVDGIKYILEDTKDLPLDVRIMLPSCVPATPFENSGAVLKADDLKDLMDEERVLGLGELMNYPGVINQDEDVLDKIIMAEGKKIDGHGPVIAGKDLNAYVCAGVQTEHECSTVEEMIERLRLGMYILIREGSAAKNLSTLLEGINKENIRRCLFCTDDRHPEDILKDGHIDNNIRLAIKEGMDPIDAIQMATINAAECFDLKGKGAIGVGYDADLVVIDNLKDFNVLRVFKDGQMVGKDLKPLFETKASDISKVENTVNIKKVYKSDLDIPIKCDTAKVIKVNPDTLVTKMVERKVDAEEGKFKFSDDDILKVAVVERHNATGNVGVALVENFKLKGGAIGSTIAHDSHNIIVIGDSDEDMLLAIDEIEKIKGGITVVSNGKVLKSLPLEIGGIMSSQPIDRVNEEFKEMLNIVYEVLNVNRELDPFMTLSFIALPVIPEAKVTDLGLFDVRKFDFTDVSL